MLTLIALILFGADIHDLGSDDFAIRTVAHARLQRHDWLAWRACFVGTLSADPERAARCRRIVADATRLEPLPLLIAPVVVRSCMDEDGWGGSIMLPRWLALPLGINLYWPWDEPPRWRWATGGVAYYLLSLGVPRQALDPGLDYLRECERKIP